MAKPKETSVAAELPQSKRAGEVADLALSGMRRHIQRLIDDEASDESALTIANLGFKAAQIGGEARKRENDEAKGEIAPHVLDAYLRNLTATQRSALVQQIQAMDKKGSVLS